MDEDGFLPGLPVEAIRAAYTAAPGNEFESGKFFSPQSSAALAANAFGFFLNQPEALPPLPRAGDCGWPANALALEAIARFPFRGGRHPCLDVLIATSTALIGIESKRYEPFRAKKDPQFSPAYWRPVWGEQMTGYERCRDELHGQCAPFKRLDAPQLVKHAFGLRTAVHRVKRWAGKRPILFYLYAEPESWPNEGKRIADADHAQHRDDIAAFAEMVAGSEVGFRSCSYQELLACWAAQPKPEIQAHAAAVALRYAV